MVVTSNCNKLLLKSNLPNTGQNKQLKLVCLLSMDHHNKVAASPKKDKMGTQYDQFLSSI